MMDLNIQSQKLISEVAEPGGPLPEFTPLRQILKNALFNSGAWAINIILTLITTPFILHKLTVEGYGIYTLLLGLVAYYNLLDLGISQGVVKYVAEYEAKRDYAKINVLINIALWIQTCTGLFGSVTLIAFAEPILRLLKVPPSYFSDTKSGLYAIAGGFFFTMLSITLSSVLMGLQRYDVTSKVNIISNSLLTIVIVVALFMGAGLREVVYLITTSAIIVFIAYLWSVKQNLPRWQFFFPKEGNLFLELFQFSGFLFMSRISSTFGEYIVRFIVGFLLGPAAVTFYIIPWKLLIAIGGLLSSAAAVIFPYASEVSALEDKMRIQKTFVEASRVYASCSIPLHLILIAFSKPILTIWMGTDFAEKGWFVLSLLAFSTLLGSLSTVPNLITMGLGYARIIGLFSILTFISYVTLVPTFTKLWGIEGTAWGMLGSVAPGLVLVVYETKRIIGLGIWYYVKNILWFHVIPLMASLAFTYLFLRTMPAETTVWTLGLIPLLLAVYFSLMVRLGWVTIA